MQYTIDDSYVPWIARARFLQTLAYPVQEIFYKECIIEEYAGMEDALPVLLFYTRYRLNAEIQAGRFIYVATCPMYI